MCASCDNVNARRPLTAAIPLIIVGTIKGQRRSKRELRTGTADVMKSGKIVVGSRKPVQYHFRCRVSGFDFGGDFLLRFRYLLPTEFKFCLQLLRKFHGGLGCQITWTSETLKGSKGVPAFGIFLGPKILLGAEASGNNGWTWVQSTKWS